MVSERLSGSENDSADNGERADEYSNPGRLASVSKRRKDLLHAFVPVKFERTNDMELVAQIARHSKIYPASSDDYAPPPHEWSPLQHESIWHVLVSEGKELLGMFVFVPESRICWRIHVCLLPCAYGERTARAGRGVTRWIFENSPVLRLTGSIPEYNRLAIRFARLSGWKEFGVNKLSHMKDGKLHDQLLFGISKEELTWDS